MGSIAVDKGIARHGSPGDFYGRLDPELIAEHILATSQRDIREVVQRIMRREHPGLWSDLPVRVRETVHERVRAQLPEIVREVTNQIGDRIDQLLDIKLMVIRHIEEKPDLANRIFLAVGRKQLRFIINFGFWFGLVCGIPWCSSSRAFPYWWVLPVAGTVIGWTTTWLAIEMIFRPTERRKVGPLLLHGLFLRRQREVADDHALSQLRDARADPADRRDAARLRPGSRSAKILPALPALGERGDHAVADLRSRGLVG